MSKVYTVSKIIRMQHCDAAGVVFTPQYFNLFVEALEDWFREGLDFGFPQMVMEKNHGLPVMRFVAKFFKPSRLGDVLDFHVKIKRLRRNNFLVNIEGFCGAERRCMADVLHGFADLDTMALADWPNNLLLKLEEYWHHT
ncbi:acyl-CoA thioesterase [Leptospira fainei]|nr:thioesterase family protein [Leptospira fainei]